MRAASFREKSLQSQQTTVKIFRRILHNCSWPKNLFLQINWSRLVKVFRRWNPFLQVSRNKNPWQVSLPLCHKKRVSVEAKKNSVELSDIQLFADATLYNYIRSFADRLLLNHSSHNKCKFRGNKRTSERTPNTRKCGKSEWRGCGLEEKEERYRWVVSVTRIFLILIHQPWADTNIRTHASFPSMYSAFCRRAHPN